MARRLYTNYQQVYKILKNHPVMSDLLEEFEIQDDDFKNVCLFLTKNYSTIMNYDLKDLYYSSTYSTLEADEDSPYVKRVEEFSNLPTGDFIEDGTVYYVKTPLPGAYYKYNLLSKTWTIDASYTEMTPSEYTQYQNETGHMIWETDSGYYILVLKQGRREWDKIENPSSNIITKGQVVRVNDLPTSTSSIGDIYKVVGEDILDILAVYYGFSPPQYMPPWDTIRSSEGTKLTELLYFTLYTFVYISSDNFYENHILDFIPEYDRDEMSSKPKIKLFMQSLGKKLDLLEDYMFNLENIYDIDNCPEELLDYLGQNLGYEKEDFSLNNISFRELLKNIIEVYKVKGTNYSFSFFFKFLGFSINLKEFYFNRDVENPEAFPGADDSKIQYYLTTTNPILDVSTNKTVSNLTDIKNINDWDTELTALNDNGCENSVKYMLGFEAYNNGTKMHSNPWTYFKTNLIEYELTPFFDKLNLTSDDNETIKKYVKFLSPTYLFTWINVNLSEWIESYSIQNETFLTSMNVTLSDPRPTPSPWPAHKQGEMGVPAHEDGIPYTKKTSSDIGFTGPYLDYEQIDSYFYLYGNKLEQQIPIYPLASLEAADMNGDNLLSYYTKDTNFYWLKENLNEFQILSGKYFLKRHGIRFTDNLPFRLMRNPLSLYEDDNIFVETQQYSILDFYEKGSQYYMLRNNLTEYEKTIAKKLMNILGRIGDTFTVEIENNMDLDGDDQAGTILKRDGSTVRQKDHPSYIVDMTHCAKIRLAFDNLAIIVNKLNDETSYAYSSTCFPSLPEKMSPFSDEIYYDSNNIKFTWSDVYGAQQYRIQIASDYNFSNIIEENTSNINSYTTENKFHNEAYFWRLKVKNENEFSGKFDRETYNFYLNRIGEKSGENYLYPPTTSVEKSFFASKFEKIYYNNTTDCIGYQLKSDTSQNDIDILKQILFYVGYNWSSWSSVINFDLEAIPFPFDGEVIDKETKYIVPVRSYNSDTGQTSLNGLPLLLQWDEVDNADLYEVELNKDPNFGLQEDGSIDITSRLFVVSVSKPQYQVEQDSDPVIGYYIKNGTYYWRYRIKHSEYGWQDWIKTYSFTVNL